MITPYGPCVSMISNTSLTGYVVVKSNSTEFLSYDASRASARKMAEEYCHKWYATAQPAANQLLWFKPDTEAPAGSSMLAPTQPSPAPEPPAQSPEAAGEERSGPPAEIVRAIPGSPSSQVGAKVAPFTLPTAREYTWQTEPNGDKVLSGSSRPCATLENLSLRDPGKVRVRFSDGTSKDYFVSQILEATQAATDFCRATDGSAGAP